MVLGSSCAEVEAVTSPNPLAVPQPADVVVPGKPGEPLGLWGHRRRRIELQAPPFLAVRSRVISSPGDRVHRRGVSQRREKQYDVPAGPWAQV